MKIIQKPFGWGFINQHGPVPKELQGEWNSLGAAQKALDAFRAKVRSKAKNVTEISRRRREARYTAISG